uniref:Putative secreted protein n=1 Tax=Ixodes ricinus TaxID=34613 RepID=A0A6B0TVN4_IXORI
MWSRRRRSRALWCALLSASSPSLSMSTSLSSSLIFPTYLEGKGIGDRAVASPPSPEACERTTLDFTVAASQPTAR